MRKGILAAIILFMLVVTMLVPFVVASAQAEAAPVPPAASSHGIKIYWHKDKIPLQPAAVNNLTYHGGPVMAGTDNDYLIFWEPTGNVSTNYNSLIQRYFTDVENTGLYQNNTQYTDSTGMGPVNGHLAGVWVDTNPYPESPVLDQDLRTEISRAQSQFGWTTSGNNEFFVFLQSGTDLCTDSSHADCASNSFCAYHGWAGQLIYGAIPYAPDFCGGGTNGPNHDVADTTINVVSHEQMESTSDPYGTGWIDDVDNEEEADKCVGVFGPLNPDGSNQNWNGHPYLVQEEWSNAISACTQGHTSVTPTPTPATTPPATVTPTPIPGMACQVTYMVQSQWPGGFTASITIANISSTSINGWTLIFTFPGSQQVTQGWNGTFSQAGSQVTVKNLSYNAAIAAAGSVSLGFNGSWTGSNPNPTSFTFNGSSCSTA